MSTKTKLDRRSDVMAMSAAYKVPIGLSQGEIDECVDFGKFDTFSAIFPECYDDFRITGQSFGHGEVWPTGFFAYAGRAYVVNTGVEYPCRFAKPGELPMLIRNNRVKGRALQPVIYTADKKWYMIPDTATPVIEWFKLPDAHADPATADTATDTMPEHSEPLIVRSAFEFMLKLMLDKQAALALTRDEIQHASDVLNTLYEEKFKTLNTDTLADLG